MAPLLSSLVGSPLLMTLPVSSQVYQGSLSLLCPESSLFGEAPWLLCGGGPLLPTLSCSCSPGSRAASRRHHEIALSNSSFPSSPQQKTRPLQPLRSLLVGHLFLDSSLDSVPGVVLLPLYPSVSISSLSCGVC